MRNILQTIKSAQSLNKSAAVILGQINSHIRADLITASDRQSDLILIINAQTVENLCYFHFKIRPHYKVFVSNRILIRNIAIITLKEVPTIAVITVNIIGDNYVL